MATIPVNNAHYYYEQHGGGEPLVLIAGYSCDHTFWDDIIEELAKRYCIMMFDNRAVGQTRDKEQSFTLERMAEESIELIQTLGITKPVVLGQSMGGIIAQIMAKKEPDLMSKLIILNSAKTINARTKMVLSTFVKLLQEEAPLETVIEASLPWFFSARFLENEKNIKLFKDKLMSNPHPQTLTDLERQLNALMEFDDKNWNQVITVPTLVVSAEEDIVCPAKESQYLEQYITQAKWITIAGGHASPIENPTEVIGAIIPFIE